MKFKFQCPEIVLLEHSHARWFYVLTAAASVLQWPSGVVATGCVGPQTLKYFQPATLQKSLLVPV